MTIARELFSGERFILYLHINLVYLYQNNSHSIAMKHVK